VKPASQVKVTSSGKNISELAGAMSAWEMRGGGPQVTAWQTLGVEKTVEEVQCCGKVVALPYTPSKEYPLSQDIVHSAVS